MKIKIKIMKSRFSSAKLQFSETTEIKGSKNQGVLNKRGGLHWLTLLVFVLLIGCGKEEEPIKPAIVKPACTEGAKSFIKITSPSKDNIIVVRGSKYPITVSFNKISFNSCARIGYAFIGITNLTTKRVITIQDTLILNRGMIYSFNGAYTTQYDGKYMLNCWNDNKESVPSTNSSARYFTVMTKYSSSCDATEIYCKTNKIDVRKNEEFTIDFNFTARGSCAASGQKYGVYIFKETSTGFQYITTVIEKEFKGSFSRPSRWAEKLSSTGKYLIVARTFKPGGIVTNQFQCNIKVI